MISAPVVDDDGAFHHGVTGAAHLRALEHVAAGRRRIERDRHLAAAAFRDHHVRRRALDPEAVIRVVAAQLNLEQRAFLDDDLGWREGEAFGGHVDDLARRLLRLLRHEGSRRNERGEKRAEWCHGYRHEPQNHQPRPTLNEFGARMMPLWFFSQT
jgi:hypothetical protein